MSRRHIRYEEYASSGRVEREEDESVPQKLVKMANRRDSRGSETAVSSERAPSRSPHEVEEQQDDDTRGFASTSCHRQRQAHSQSREQTSSQRYAASTSHRQNDAYLQEFDQGFEALRLASSSSAQSKAAISESELATGTTHVIQKAAFARKAEVVAEKLTGASWRTGPRQPEGSVMNVSSQPLMCMAINGDETQVVVGSCDHALYVVNLHNASGANSSTSGKRTVSSSSSKPRVLYSKKYGHTEWVTCALFLSDNRVVSGAMDSKLCLWDATGVRCEDLVGHAGSISLVQKLSDELVLSAGYDKTIRVWNVNRKASSKGREASCLKAHSAPIMDASVLGGSQRNLSGNSTVVSGDRDGCVHVVDLQQGKILRKISSAHTGHITSVLGSRQDTSGQVFYSGGQDGVVRVWDLRQKGAVASLKLHVDVQSGKCGAVGFLREPSGTTAEDHVLLTGGADGRIQVLDARESFATRFTFAEHRDFLYSLHVHNHLCFSGAGNGMLHVHDWQQGKLLYGLGANQAAVRAIETTTSQLIAAGDDGSVMVYNMD